MYKSFFLIALLLIVLSSCQKKEIEKYQIDEITFSYQGGLKIPYNKVTIYVLKNNDSAKVIVQSRPLFDQPKWKYSNIDKRFNINTKTFEDFAETARSFDQINIDKAYIVGNDGSTWEIEFGSKGKNKSYSFWNPESETKNRGLTEFRKMFERIIDISKLNKKEILEN
ncbi:hypothetical protein K6T82_12725 [Flavobacterium sp. 17A]|uniref:Lipoprotein n=2 Tax=Flavobacterium potami TaxID=2872310 RepID=A0A9X1HC39_9FLAO|nr:hypothetical protein [Flavobacterium potami]